MQLPKLLGGARAGLIGLTLASLSTLATAATAPPAADRAQTEQVQVRLLSETAHVYPGQILRVGIQQKIIPHWHTYWKNPGDSGTSTAIAWSLPVGASISEILWPAPRRFDVGPITNYGYEKEVLLLNTLTVPSSQRPGSVFALQAQVNWLVCEEVCIPQSANLKLDLPVVADRAALEKSQAAVSEQKALIDAAAKTIPQLVDWPARYLGEGDQVIAAIDVPETIAGKAFKDLVASHQVNFFPSDWGVINHNAAQASHMEGGQLRIRVQAGENPPKAQAAVHGVVVIQAKSKQGEPAAILHAFEHRDPARAAIPATVRTTAMIDQTASNPAKDDAVGFWGALLFAFLGGVVLNLMPCVFPVLSIKALALLKHTELTVLQKRLQGLAYAAGVLASFSLLAAALIALKHAGAQVGWGFQFQSPYFVLAVAYLIFVVGLSLSGVFFIGGNVANLGADLANRHGYSGSFFTGVLATIVATPCTAPFMGAALGFAITQPALLLWLIFMSLGLGLAAPYLLVSSWPVLQRRLPRPGLWMERVKQGLAFPMYGAAVWLVWVLAQQAGTNAVPLALSGMIVLALAAWVFDITRPSSGKKRWLANAFVALSVGATVLLSYSGVQWLLEIAASNPEKSSATSGQTTTEKSWQAYSATGLAELRSQGKPVFVNLTAAWCITCLVNERVALNQQSVKDTFKKEGIAYLKGDWTNQDPEISALLKQFGRSGVPLYLFYPGGAASKAVVLPQILTPDIVISSLSIH